MLFCFRQPENEELKSIYSVYMKAVFKQTIPTHPVWSATSKVASLVNSMIRIYSEVKYRSLGTQT